MVRLERSLRQARNQLPCRVVMPSGAISRPCSSASQTAGPFFHYAPTPEQSGYHFTGLASEKMTDASMPGAAIRFEGAIYDGLGQPMSDALVELWQADAMGRYAHPADARSSNVAFKGFGRCATDAKGHFAFTTVKPGAIGDGQAPHITLILFTRGGQNHLYTREAFGPGSAQRVELAP